VTVATTSRYTVVSRKTFAHGLTSFTSFTQVMLLDCSSNPTSSGITQSSRRLRSRRQIQGPLQMAIAVKKLVVETWA
jgi:hypothetical protein